MASQRSRLRTVSVTTSWVSLPDVAGSDVSVLNNTGADLQLRMRDLHTAAEVITLKDGQGMSVGVCASAAEIQILAAAGAAGVHVIVDGARFICGVPSAPVLGAGTAAIGSVKDNGAAWTTVRGVAGVQFTSADQSAAVASITDAPTTGQKLVLTDLILSADTAMRVDLYEESNATVITSFFMAAGSTVNVVTRGKFKHATANKKWQIRTSAAGNVSALAFYYSEA